MRNAHQNLHTTENTAMGIAGGGIMKQNRKKKQKDMRRQ